MIIETIIRTCSKCGSENIDRNSRDYKCAQKYHSDFGEAYQQIFPEETHQAVGKESGQTNHANDGIIHCGSGWLDSCEKRIHLPSQIISISWRRNCSFIATPAFV